MAGNRGLGLEMIEL